MCLCLLSTDEINWYIYINFRWYCLECWKQTPISNQCTSYQVTWIKPPSLHQHPHRAHPGPLGGYTPYLTARSPPSAAITIASVGHTLTLMTSLNSTLYDGRHFQTLNPGRSLGVGETDRVLFQNITETAESCCSPFWCSVIFLIFFTSGIFRRENSSLHRKIP